MNSKLLKYVSIEMIKASKAFEAENYDQAFNHLERAHILSQRYTKAHLMTHWWMLKIGCKRGNIKEVIGQFFRLFAALIFSKVWVPRGNTGGTSAFNVMDIPDDLSKILAKYGS